MSVSGIHERKSRKHGSPTKAFGDDGIGLRFKLRFKLKVKFKVKSLTNTQA